MHLILEKIQKIAQIHPNHVAIAEHDKVLSYADLNAYSDRLAARLDSLGLSDNVTVAYLGKVDMSLIVALLAAHKVGLAFVYLDSKLPLPALVDIIDHARVGVVINCKSSANLAGELVRREKPVLLTIEQYQQEKGNLPPLVDRNIPAEALSHIRYTSGSSGNPKGVPLSRRHVDAMLEIFDDFLTPSMEDRFGLFGHFWPLVIFRALCVGARLDCFDFPSLGAGALNEWLIKRKISHVFTYPVLFRQLMTASEQKLPDVSFVHLSGEPVSKHDINLFEARCLEHARLHNSYGASEYPWIAGYFHHHGDAMRFDHVPLGLPVAPASVQLLDPKGHPVKLGQTGEIVIYSDYLPNGYHRDNIRTVKAFREEPSMAGRICYHTGDLAYFDKSGLLHGAGRNDQQLKIRGLNVSPADIEHALLKHPGINQVVVLPFTDTENQTRLVCHYTATTQIISPDNALHEFLSKSLPSQLIPTIYKKHNVLPLTSTGKLDRRALNNTHTGDGKTDKINTDDQIINNLAQIWSDLLKHNQFNHDDDFLSVGGDSLLAMSMLVKIESQFKKRLTLESVIVHGFSIKSLATLLKDNNRSKRCIEFNPKGQRQPLFLTHLAGGHFSDYLHLINQLDYEQPVIGLYPSGLTPNSKPSLTVEDMSSYCVKELQKHTNAAPATLAGYSFGALVAFTMAQQLSNMGKPLNHLILIDPPIHFTDPFKTFKEIGMPVWAGQWEMAFNRCVQLLPYLSGFGKVPADIDIAHRAASLKFRPNATLLKNKTTLILASKNPKTNEIESVWNRILNGRVDVINIQATHRSLMHEPDVEMLSRRITACLMKNAQQPNPAV